FVTKLVANTLHAITDGFLLFRKLDFHGRPQYGSVANYSFVPAFCNPGWHGFYSRRQALFSGTTSPTEISRDAFRKRQ
ncbi:hypothetical protein, partial [Rhizorhabdus argentea]|uniref:hypothetical protein n=1 Tax=Rhizorhabdus argentea TaxID=1387174 RepID=UPI0030EB3D5E